MSRYIREYSVGIGGGTINVPKCSKFIHVEKVASKFRLVAEVWGDVSSKVDIEIRVVQKEVYLIPELQYIGTCLVNTDFFHFYYMPANTRDEGSDGGAPKQERSLVTAKPVSRAGGLKEL